jgi:hypothetical protein
MSDTALVYAILTSAALFAAQRSKSSKASKALPDNQEDHVVHTGSNRLRRVRREKPLSGIPLAWSFGLGLNSSWKKIDVPIAEFPKARSSA